MKRIAALARASRLRSLQLVGLVLNSQLALGALAKVYVRAGMTEVAAAERVARERSMMRRRTVTACFALVAIGVVMNNSPRRSTAHQIAAALIYAGLFLLATQFSNRWFLKPGDLKKFVLRR